MFDFGEQLRILRKKAGLTQEELGSRLNVEKSTVSKYEKNISYPTLRRSSQLVRNFERVARSTLRHGEAVKYFRFWSNK
ncbi:MAG: helix-turn-helix domain-containing protein [Ruminococcus sp.]|nr:helix-turn-helix domain-containing protein [Ruminococcus sp.]